MQDDSHAPLLGLQRFSHGGLPPLMRLRDVPVLTATRAVRTLSNSGPRWPGWAGQFDLRHNRNGKPMGMRPQNVPKRLKRIDESLVWGGWVHRQFGHQIAEYATRLLQGAAERPDDRIVFALWPGGASAEIPGYFWQIADWFGIARDRIMIVEESFVAAELWTAAQAEALGGPGPPRAYLDLLARNAEARGLRPVENDILYVSRVNMLAHGLATNLGESYLSDCLQELGVPVLAPESEPIAAQLAQYAGARTLVFAEGSAVHGRQLLGHVEQDIMILVRRPLARIGLASILPRCRNLVYAETTKHLIARVLADGPDDLARALSVYDVPDLFRAFARIGVDLGRVWDESAFRARCAADLLVWLQAAFSPAQQGSSAVNWPKSIAQVSGGIEQAGFADVLEKAGVGIRLHKPPDRIIGKLRRMASRALGRTRPRHTDD